MKLIITCDEDAVGFATTAARLSAEAFDSIGPTSKHCGVVVGGFKFFVRRIKDGLSVKQTGRPTAERLAADQAIRDAASEIGARIAKATA